MSYTFRHSHQIVEDIYTPVKKVRENIINYTGFLLNNKEPYNIEEVGFKRDFPYAMKELGLTERELLEVIADQVLASGALPRFRDIGGNPKQYLTNGIIRALSRIRVGNDVASRRQGTVIVRKTKSGQPVGTMNEYMKETLKPEPPKKTEAEEYEEMVMRLLGL